MAGSPKPPAFERRLYQSDARDCAFEAWSEGHQHTLLIQPTGTGKTAVASLVIERARQEFEKPCLFMVHRGNLVNQAYRAFTSFGLKAVVEKAELKAKDAKITPDVIVGSIQTMQGDRLARWDRHEFGVIITDESHHAAAQMHQSIYKHFLDYYHLGITATQDGPGDIGKVFTKTCYEMKFRDAVEQGWLVPIDARKVMVQIDLRKIKCTGGDYNAGDLAERIGPHVEDLCRHVRKYADNRFLCMFCPDVGSAKACAEVLCKLGIESRYVAGSAGRFGMPRAESEAILADFAARRFQAIICCDLLFEGWDAPHVSAVVVARPTRKRYRYVQSVGRGTRPCPELGKRDLLVLDFDWLQDDSSRDLCTTTDLFGDSEEDDVLSFAREIMRRKGGDPLQAIEEAKSRLYKPKRLDLVLTGRFSDAKILSYDPAGVTAALGSQLAKWDFDIDGKNPLTPKQQTFLERMGVRDTEGLSKWGANKILGALARRSRKGLATARQVVTLKNHGIDAREMSQREASDIIGVIKQGESRVQTQKPESVP